MLSACYCFAAFIAHQLHLAQICSIPFCSVFCSVLFYVPIYFMFCSIFRSVLFSVLFCSVFPFRSVLYSVLFCILSCSVLCSFLFSIPFCFCSALFTFFHLAYSQCLFFSGSKCSVPPIDVYSVLFLLFCSIA